MRAPNGTPVQGKTLDFRVDSDTVGSAATDSTGLASLGYAVTAVWGQHVLRVTFGGDSSYAFSMGSSKLFSLAVDGGYISGIVMDAADYQRIAFASVSLPEGRMTVTTNSEGVFAFPGVPSGGHTIVGSQIGYEETSLNVTVEARGTTVVPLLLKEPGSTPPTTNDMTAVSAVVVSVIFVTVFAILVIAFVMGRKHASRYAPPSQVPENVARWLAGMYGVDSSKLMPIEVMPVADGTQMALMDIATGSVIVVRLDRYGTPVYANLRSTVR